MAFPLTMKNPLLTVSEALERSCNRRLRTAMRELQVYKDEQLSATDTENIPLGYREPTQSLRFRLLKNLWWWLSLFF